MPCRSIFSGCRQESSQKLYKHRLNRRSKDKHRCIGCTLFQRACFGGLQLLFSTGWTDASESKHRCIKRPMFQRACLNWSVNLFSTGWTDAPTEHAPVQWRKRGYVSELQRLQLGHRETGWTDASKQTPIGSSGAHGFSAVDFQRLFNSFHSI